MYSAYCHCFFFFSIARQKYCKHAKKAEENQKSFLSLIIDIMDQSKTSLPQFHTYHKIKLSLLMVGHTHEDMDQMFSSISVHLTGNPTPTIPVLQSLMRDPYYSERPTNVDKKSS
ncbi:uncharacterized protein LOC144624136 [Crassostrea virginica]